MKRRAPRWMIVVVLVVVLAGGAGWAAATVFRPIDDPLVETSFTYATVAPGEVSASLNLNTVAAWSPIPAAANTAAGTVTGVSVSPGDELSQGSELYTVDLRPVVVAAGAVPAFRAIGEGMTGADVAQLQQMLIDLGFLRGRADGDARAATATAIRAWQKSLDRPQTGTVELGDVVFVPALPTRVSLDTAIISRGMTVAGGEQVVRALPPTPGFTIPVTEAQAARIPAGTRVEITAPDGSTWEAAASEQRRDPASQSVVVTLTPVGDGAICGESCGLVPVSGEVQLSSRIVTVAAVSGLVVPSAALVSDAAGAISVLDESGSRIAVLVKASANGMSVIEGASDGLRVRVPGEDR